MVGVMGSILMHADRMIGKVQCHSVLVVSGLFLKRRSSGGWSGAERKGFIAHCLGDVILDEPRSEMRRGPYYAAFADLVSSTMASHHLLHQDM